MSWYKEKVLVAYDLDISKSIVYTKPSDKGMHVLNTSQLKRNSINI